MTRKKKPVVHHADFTPGRTKALTLSIIMPVFNARHVVEDSLRSVLNLDHELIAGLQVVVVDDGSTDGSSAVLSRLAESDERVVLLSHSERRGRGASIRTALEKVTGEVTVCHDPIQEYDPNDIPKLLVPMVEEGADAVFGSRYLTAKYRRTLRHRHTLVNKALTFISNWFTDLNLSDLETCYKAVRTSLLKSIPLRSDDFRVEVELAFKLAKRGARVFETPVSYLPRDFPGGPTTGAKDAALALVAMARFTLVQDLYQEDEYGSHILSEMDQARRFNLWMGETLRPYIGDRVMEVGAGIGTLTNQFIPRQKYLASDINPSYLDFLRSHSIGKPYLNVKKVDVTNAADFEGLEEQFDTTLIVNVLEHVEDEHQALQNLWSALEPGGRCVVLVPQHPWLYGTLDEALDHRERYTVEHLRDSLERAGFWVETIFDFNRFAVPAWWFNGKVRKQKTFSRIQLKFLDTFMPVFKEVDKIIPWSGQSIIGVGVKKR
jgi:glycosyltransferase involved in cell wall biosynthesis